MRYRYFKSAESANIAQAEHRARTFPFNHIIKIYKLLDLFGFLSLILEFASHLYLCNISTAKQGGIELIRPLQISLKLAEQPWSTWNHLS
jgi:hypothetical protein